MNFRDPRIQLDCHLYCDTTLTYVTLSITNRHESRSREGRRPVTPVGGASAVPAGVGSSPAHSGGSGIMPAGTMTGVRGASLELGAALAGATRRVSAPPPTKPGLS